jgi:CubicO group peptidase (beta-lactamase class C family)
MLTRAILGGLVLVAAEHAQAQSAPPTPAKAIDSLLREAYPADQPGAAVLVIQHDTVVLRRGFGLARMEPAGPVEPEMRFRIGSMTKQFTAVAILQLIGAGKLRLETPVGQVLPETPAVWHDITVAQLLQHTSGLGAEMEQPDSEDPKPCSVAELLAGSRDVPLAFAPGTDWAYSNTGYFVLGAMIERLSGLSYAAYIKQHITTPSGLRNTGYDAGDDDNPRRARGYRFDAAGRAEPAGFLHMSQAYAAGALVSTVDDLWRWEKQLASGRLVSRDALNQAWTAAGLPDGRRTGYGLGWFASEVVGHPTHEHGGAVNGFSSYALAVPDQGVYVVVLSNRQVKAGAPQLVLDLSVRITRMLLGGAPRPRVAAQQDLASIQGIFRLGGPATRTITAQGDTLYSQATGRPRIPLVPVGRDHFVVEASETHFLFVRDGSGRVIGMRSRPRLGPEQYAARIE